MSAGVADRKEAVLVKALEAVFTGDRTSLPDVFAVDVVGWSPNFSVNSREELEDEFEENDSALSNVAFSVDTLDLVGDKAIAEWRVAADHSGPLLISDDLLLEPTGRRVVLAGATFAEFRGDRICAFRSYFDDAAIVEQLLFEC
ncbi:hypothetical protein BH10ACT3_BH10ACT3_15500 [soil metagenome]